jgi:xanthine dehydrogenase accessory factor
MMLLRSDGQVFGSVSGGCLEDDLIERMHQGELASGPARVLRYGVTKDEAFRFGLPCGGTMELVVEPEPDWDALRRVSEGLKVGQLLLRSVTTGKSGNRVSPAKCGDRTAWDGETLAAVMGPARRLLLVGAGQISHYLAPMAQALGYRVYLCDPREAYTAAWSVPGVSLLTCMPDDAVLQLALDPHSAVVALTHDPKLDDMVLLEALKSPAFYVGALGSPVTNQRRRARLAEHFDLLPEELNRLHGPVGLAIGSRTPPEIAIAVMAEMIAVANGVALGELLTESGLCARC